MSPEVNKAIASLEQSVRNLMLRKMTDKQFSSTALRKEVADILTAAKKLAGEELDTGAKEMVRFSKAVCAQLGGTQTAKALPLDPTEQDIIKKLTNIGQIKNKEDIERFYSTIEKLGPKACQEIIFKYSVQRYCSDPLGKPDPSQLYIGLYNIFDTLSQTNPEIKRIQPPHEAARTSFYKMSQTLSDNYKKTDSYKDKLKMEKSEIFKNGVQGMKATLEATASLTDSKGKAIKDKLMKKIKEIELAVEKLHPYQVQYLNGELRQLMAQYVDNIEKNLKNPEIKKELERLNEKNSVIQKILQGTTKEQLGFKLTLNMTGPAFQDALEVTGKALIEATVSTLDPTDKRIEAAKKTDSEFKLKLEKNACETDILSNAKSIINRVIANTKLQEKLHFPSNYVGLLERKLDALKYSGSETQAVLLKKSTEQEIIESAKDIMAKISHKENKKKSVFSALWQGIKKSIQKNISDTKQAMNDIKGWFTQLEKAAAKLTTLQSSQRNNTSELSKAETQEKPLATQTSPEFLPSSKKRPVHSDEDSSAKTISALKRPKWR